ncbi:MAG: carbohydrate kinase family protein [Verrucomicrobiota bacterium]
MPSSLAIVGSTVVDIILPDTPRLPRWPTHTEFTSDNLVLLPRPPLVTIGGNGANAAYVAARRGARVSLHTTLGDDSLGQLARTWLRDAGCTLHTSSRRVATALNVTAADRRQRRATFFHPPAVPPLPRFSRNATLPHAVLVCGWPHPPLPTLTRFFRQLRPRSVLTALDPGPILGEPWPLADFARVLAHTDLLLLNEHELRTLSRQPSLAAAQRWIRSACPGDIVIKRGPRGALWLPRANAPAVSIAAPAIRPINTVGAGDTFNGALLAALVAGKPLSRALREAATLAARVVASGRGVLGV